jgi:hypothetical protein
MNIYQKYSNSNAIPALLFAGVLIGEFFMSIDSAATIELLSESGIIASSGYDHILLLLSIFSLLISVSSSLLKCRKNKILTFSILL